jgi:antitoxin MazE
MKLQIAKWGNSLAVRLPVECTRAVGLKEGDSVEAIVTETGQITLQPAQEFDRAVFIRRMQIKRSSMPMTSATVAVMRKQDRY